MLKACDICESTEDLTHKAYQTETTVLRDDGGIAGPVSAIYVPVCAECEPEHSVLLPSLTTV